MDVGHIRLYDDIAAGSLDGARSVPAGHIANVKNYAVSRIERMNGEKNKKIQTQLILKAQATQTRWNSFPCTSSKSV